MAEQLSDSAIVTLVKNKLNGERIRLWLPPYTNDDGTEAEFTLELKKRYSDELCLPAERVFLAVDDLRTSSLERSEARNHFLIDSLATLKIKIANKQNLTQDVLFIETKLDVLGSFLKQKVAEKCDVESTRVKLIACGRLIVDDVSLQQQEIQVNTSIMAIILYQVDEVSSKIYFLNKVREDAEILANQTVESNYSYMVIADQNHRPIDLPKKERKMLTFAMILNEKGKSAMNRKEYSDAILLLLEADKEFQNCGSDILKLVDNFALLCMDITWCYLCLRSIEDLPDAERRLATCEEFLKKSYGPNLERLISIKGSSGCEAVLFVRLKLLKGVVAFYRRQWKVAEKCFSEVDNELKRLTVDDEKLSQLMAMGYSAAEARLALRSCNGNCQWAVEYLVNQSKEKEKLKMQDAKDDIIRKLSHAMGKTQNGEWINAGFYKSLLSMGFAPAKALQALKHANNRISIAIQYLEEEPDFIKAIDSRIIESLITDEMINRVNACGFTINAAKECLVKHGGNVQAAIDELLSTGGIVMKDAAGPSTSASTSSDSQSETGSSKSKDLIADSEHRQMENEAFERLKNDISTIDYKDSHLDLTLAEESEFLTEYTTLLMYARQ